MANEIKLILVGDKKDVFNFKYAGETFRPYYIISGDVDMEVKNKYCNKITSQIKGYNFDDFEKASRSAGNVSNAKGKIIFACLSSDTEKAKGYVYPNMQDMYEWVKGGKVKSVSEVEEKSLMDTNYSIKTKDLRVVELFRSRGCKILTNGTDKKKEYFILETEIVNGKKRQIPLKYNKKPRLDYRYDGWSLKKEIASEIFGNQQVQEVIVNVYVGKELRKLEGIRVFKLKENHAYFRFIDKKVFGGDYVFLMESWCDENGNIIIADPTKKRNEFKSFEIYQWGTERKDK